MSVCFISSNKGVCIPNSLISNRSFPDLNDKDKDGFICSDEAVGWISSEAANFYAPLVGSCSVLSSNDAKAIISRAKDFRADLNSKASRLSEYCSDNNLIAEKLFKSLLKYISLSERIFFDSTLPAMQANGTGSLGITYTGDGDISRIKAGSGAEKAGLKAGDKMISINGFPLTSTSDFRYYDMEDILFSLPWPINIDDQVTRLYTYASMKKFGTPAQDLFFGPCGSVATVEVERDGKRLCLDVVRDHQ